MSLQYNEYYHGRTGLTVGLNRQLFSRQTPWQLVEVYETDSWGNLMTIDGMVMLSERDEFVYHEMLSYVGLATHLRPETVLIIGGGDGGTAREVMKHPSVSRVDLVEIDEAVTEASKLFLPEVGDLDNPKLHLHFRDGIEFVKVKKGVYDLIIVDGSDPVGPAEGLFQKSFFEACYEALRPGGVLTTQTESPWVKSYHSSIRRVYHVLESLFDHTGMYLSYIPLYPGGMWSMMCASRGESPRSGSVYSRAVHLSDQVGSLRYYNHQVHKASFALPGFVREILE
ncbi:MAG: polyamine aminopropyltransferase [Balneolaceae bacterium]